MAKVEPHYHSFDFIESRKSKVVPLPYLIRPRGVLPLFDSFSLYSDDVEYSSINDGLLSESDEDDLPMEAVETSSLEKETCSGLVNESNATLSEMDGLSDEKDEDYVLVCDSETEQRVIQMMELSKDKDLPVSPLAASNGVSEKDTVGESESEDAGSSNDDWVVV